MSKKIVLVTGARGVGKSTALAGIVPATQEEWSKVLVFDSEDSWNDLATKKGDSYFVKDIDLRIGEYVRAYDRFKPDEDLLTAIAKGKLPWVSKEKLAALVDYYQWFVDTLNDKLSQGKYRYVFVDTIEPIEAGLTAWAETNRDKSGWSGRREFGKLETEAVRPLYENLIEGIGRRGVEYVGLTSHLRQPWVDNKPVMNKVEPGGRLKLLARIAYMMVWLVHEPTNDDGAPAGLILKARISKMAAVNGHLAPRRVLPERIPHFAWSNIEQYVKTPANFTTPATGERMSDSEREMISELLNDEQMRLMLLSAEIEAKDQPLMMPTIPSNGDTPVLPTPPVRRVPPPL